MKRVLVLVLICLSLFAIAGCSESPALSSSVDTPEKIIQEPITYPAIVYEVDGSAQYASVTLTNRDGGTEQYGKILIPWTYTDKSFTGDYLYISAQNRGGSGSIIVSIYVNDYLWKRSRSSGAYVVATASGYRNQ